MGSEMCIRDSSNALMITENDYSREIVPIQTFSSKKSQFGERVRIDFLSLLFLSDKKIISAGGVGKDWKWILISAIRMNHKH